MNMGPPRPPPKTTGSGSRSTPPPSSSPPPTASNFTRPMGKIVRIPRTKVTTTGADSRPTSTTATTRVPVRKRLPPSPPRDSESSDSTSVGAGAVASTSRSFVRQRENPNPPPPTAAAATGGPRVWKRRAIQHPSKAEDPDPPPKEEPKPVEHAPIQVEEAPTKKPPETREEPDPLTMEEGEVGQEAFDRVMMEFQELMARSTAWVAEALGSILGDLRNLAEKGEGKGRLGELVKGSVAEVLEPAGRHVEVIGDLGKGLEEVVEQFRAVEQSS